MATAKQLAALKKGRESMAKKRAANKTVSKPRKKVGKKSTARLKTKYVVKITTKQNKVGYSTNNGTIDTDIKLASKLSLSYAEKRAYEIFNNFKKYLNSVEVVLAPK